MPLLWTHDQRLLINSLCVWNVLTHGFPDWANIKHMLSLKIISFSTKELYKCFTFPNI